MNFTEHRYAYVEHGGTAESSRGFLVAIAPQVLTELLQTRAVDCAAPDE
ncbi:MAG: hypothetical protein WAK48_20090 [Candidatus Acidiferrum sp.]